MFKNNYYNKNKDIIIVRRRGVQELPTGVVPKHIEKHDVKNVVKPNVNKSNYENIRNIIEKSDNESISKQDVKEIKNIKNKLNIV